MSRFCLKRPVLTTVFTIIIILAGLAAMRVLPIAQYPEISPPTISVSTSYPGASAVTVANTVAAPIEQQLSGLENMLYFQSSSSSNGQLAITITFEIGSDVDKAAIDVRNRVSMAEPGLPQDVRRNGVTVAKKSGDMLLVASLQCPDGRYDDIYLSNYASLNVLDPLKRLPGAGGVQINGARDYAMRIWLEPGRLASLGLTSTDVFNAVQEQNSQYATGRIGQEPAPGHQEMTMAVTTHGRLSEPEQFENIILKANAAGSIIRLKDVAKVELGSQEYEFIGRLNSVPTTMISVNLMPGANALDLAKAVRASLEEQSKTFPAGITYSIPYDTTRFVEVSIEEVVHTLFEAVFLVFLVVYLFLQNWRATLIPTLAVPVSLIGTFIGMYILKYSINTLTLFGMVLAIGIVVDDAIVVVENVERIMHEKHLTPLEATKAAMDEVTGPVIAIVLVLVSVFVPVAFLGGMAGQLYKQFAITIAISVTFSGVTALTFSPVLAAWLLKPAAGHPTGFFKWFNSAFEWATGGYVKTTDGVIKRPIAAMLVFAGLLVIAWQLNARLPSSFVPPEDQGVFVTAVVLPDAATLDRTMKVIEPLEKIIKAHPAVDNIITFAGFDMLDNVMRPGAAALYVTLKDWSQRKTPDLMVFGVMAALQQQFAAIKEAMIVPFNLPSIPGLGTTGGFEFYVQNRGTGQIETLSDATTAVIQKAEGRPELFGLSTTLRTNVPEVFIDVDRNQAKMIGVPISDIFDALQSTIGSQYINDFNKFGRIYRVMLQAAPEFRSRPEDIDKVFVRGSSGKMIPLSTLITTIHTAGPQTLLRFNGFLSAQIIGNASPGYSSGQAIKTMEEISRQVLPPGLFFEWGGVSYQEKKTGGQSATVFIFGLVMVFLILAAQYERWSLPLTVLLAVPFGLFGALLAVWIRGMENDVFFQIGLVTLIGLAAKNAILIVEFAVMNREHGMPVVEAALQAARIRFRPILMTSMAFILGVVPLVTSSGAGAASRHSIGTGVLGGMLAATFLAIFFVPLFFVLIMKVSDRKHETGIQPDHDGDKIENQAAK
ncbi:MAG: multidrug efflux RND transporter permease subunit [Deltaproteobacteria bacterium]|nr:multidrug efflux RND transporter permease subunit [Deltaproteobacteria bacterium]